MGEKRRKKRKSRRFRKGKLAVRRFDLAASHSSSLANSPRFGETGSRESLPLARVLFLLAPPVLSRSRASSRPPSSTASPFSGFGARKKLLDIVFAASKEKNQKDPPPEFTLRECPPVPVTWSSSTWAGPTSRRPSRR